MAVALVVGESVAGASAAGASAAGASVVRASAARVSALSRGRLPQLAFLIGIGLMFGKNKDDIGSRGVFNRWHFL